jgi:pimeloyl-ACP methyl ester carboxylesterase
MPERRQRIRGQSVEQGYKERTLRTTDGLTLAFREYGSRFSRATPVLCLPGLTRNSADFHAIATDMATERRVLALDARGRGRSDYDPDYSNYNLVTEVGDVLALMTAEFDRPCMILGTSRGGLAGMILCGVRPAMLAGVVLNDIGPVLEPEGLERIMGYLGIVPDPLETWDDAVSALKATNGRDFPGLSEAEWLDWAHQTFRDEGGKPVLDYDLKLRDAVLESAGPVPEMWPQFRAMTDIPTLVLRGENSDLLSTNTVDAMRRAKPDLTAVTVKGRGHAPLLNEPESTAAIRSFLARIDAKAQAA